MNAAVLDLRDHDQRGRFIGEVCKAVSSTIRGEQLFADLGPQHLPPPSAIPHERILLGLLLNKKITLEQIVPATVRDFYVPIHRIILIALDVLGAEDFSTARVIMALRAQGVVGSDQDVIDALEGLMLDAPIVFDLNESISAVVNTGESRRLLRILQEAEIDLRTDRQSAGQVLARLRETTVG